MGAGAVQPYYKSDFCEIVMRKDYVVEVTAYAGVYDLDKVTEIVRVITEMTKQKEYLILVSSHKDSRITLRAVKYLASSDAMRYALAKAYVIQSSHHKVMANIFRVFLKPQATIKFFDCRDKADAWLRQLVS